MGLLSGTDEQQYCRTCSSGSNSFNGTSQERTQIPLHSGKTNIAMENGPGLKMIFLLKMVIFHCCSFTRGYHEQPHMGCTSALECESCRKSPKSPGACEPRKKPSYFP